MHVDLAPFLAVSVLLILIPGPDTAVVTVECAVRPPAGIAASMGVALGLLIWTAAAALGVAALLRALDVAFTALKIAGAVYLVWDPVQMLRAETRSGRRRESPPAEVAT